jgi:hypothetical protein
VWGRYNKFRNYNGRETLKSSYYRAKGETTFKKS